MRSKSLSPPSPKLTSRLVGFFWACLALICLTLGLVPRLLETTLSHSFFLFPPPIAIDSPQARSLPSGISFPTLNHQVAITPGAYQDGQWPLSRQAAIYLLGSGLPGENGNLVLYAHNDHHLFGPLKKLAPGNRFIIVDEEGQEYAYEVIETLVVSPQNTTILENTSSSAATLYTCLGLFNQKRLVIKAVLVSSPV